MKVRENEREKDTSKPLTQRERKWRDRESDRERALYI